MADASTEYEKKLVKKTTSYDPNEGTSRPLKKKKKKRGPAYAPRQSDAGKAYKKALDKATDW